MAIIGVVIGRSQAARCSVSLSPEMETPTPCDAETLKGWRHAQVNPTNPTGDYLSIEALKRHIEESCRPGTTVMVDESMQVGARRRLHVALVCSLRGDAASRGDPMVGAGKNEITTEVD